MAKEFDIVVFGATGFTGKHVVGEVGKVAEKEGNLKWAVAGRNAAKLKQILEEVSQFSGKDVRNVDIIEADVENQQSLNNMCKRTKIVLNCVGPFSLYGEQVVKACIENGADQIDVAGEPQFLESTELNYNEAAEKAKVYILGASGFDSIPCEMGIQVLRDRFDGDVNSVETILSAKTGPEGAAINSGTLESAINGIANRKALKPLRQQLFKNPVPKSAHILKPRFVMSYNEDVKNWCLPFPITDPTVVRRTNYFNYHERKIRPVQIMSYVIVPGIIAGLAMLIFGAMLFVMSHLSIGRYLLKTYPSFFTIGHFTKNGPTRSQMENTSFKMVIVGRGYDKKLPNPDEQHSQPPNKKLIVTVFGPEPGYVATPICMVQVAVCLLQERNKLPKEGGVITPGAAFRDTSLISRLESNGLQFKVGDVLHD